MAKFIEGFLVGLPIAVLSIFIGFTLYVLVKGAVTFEQFTEIVQITIWPTIALMAILFFRKVFTYLFFSMEGFNFFGAKGRLKNVEEMIRERANDLWKQEREQGKLRKERKVRQKEIDDLKNTNTTIVDRAERSLKLAEQALDANEKLEQNNFDLQQQVNSLLEQVAFLQRYTTGSPHPSVMSVSIPQSEEKREDKQG